MARKLWEVLGRDCGGHGDDLRDRYCHQDLMSCC